MNWKEYTEKALQTSTHATREKRITCCTYGLLGEFQEYKEKLTLFNKIRLFLTGNKKTPTWKKEIMFELSDCCWYIAVDTYEISYIPKFIKTKYTISNYYIPLAKLQELMKKDYRDFDYAINEKYKERIFHYFDFLYSIVIKECKKRKFNFSFILEMNIDKLMSRKERNQLKGEGDNR